MFRRCQWIGVPQFQLQQRLHSGTDSGAINTIDTFAIDSNTIDTNPIDNSTITYTTITYTQLNHTRSSYLDTTTRFVHPCANDTTSSANSSIVSSSNSIRFDSGSRCDASESHLCANLLDSNKSEWINAIIFIHWIEQHEDPTTNHHQYPNNNR